MAAGKSVEFGAGTEGFDGLGDAIKGEDGAVVAVESGVNVGISGRGGDELRVPGNVWIFTDEILDGGAVFEVLENVTDELLEDDDGVVFFELTRRRPSG